MDQDERTKIRDCLFEGAAGYSELEDSLVKAADLLMEGGEPERLAEALQQIVVAHREQLRGLYAVLAMLEAKPDGELTQSLGEIAFHAYTEARAGRNHDGSKTPSWEDLGEVQKGWEAAAYALFGLGVGAYHEAGPGRPHAIVETAVRLAERAEVLNRAGFPLPADLDAELDDYNEAVWSSRCTCGRDASTAVYSAHEGNPDGHAVGCPKWGPKS